MSSDRLSFMVRFLPGKGGGRGPMSDPSTVGYRVNAGTPAQTTRPVLYTVTLALSPRARLMPARRILVLPVAGFMLLAMARSLGSSLGYVASSLAANASSCVTLMSVVATGCRGPGVPVPGLPATFAFRSTSRFRNLDMLHHLSYRSLLPLGALVRR